MEKLQYFTDLKSANKARQELWCPDPSTQPDASFRGNELGGEVGEAQNVIKKLERERHGWAGSRDTVDHLAEELADIIICTDLIATMYGIDLDKAVTEKFNATSEKVGFPIRLVQMAYTKTDFNWRAPKIDSAILVSANSVSSDERPMEKLVGPDEC